MRAVLSLGSNLGDREAHLAGALDVLEPAVVSSVWETDPVGGPDQGSYLNLVVLCDLDASAAWERAQRAEQAAGRTREVRWGPRTLDVDVILGPDPVPTGLLVPHPRAHERAFVLAPWLEVEPEARLPQGSVAALLSGLDGAGVRRVGPLSRASG